MYISTIARFTLLEALRHHLFIMMIAVVAGVFGLAEFLGELSITESRQVRAAVTASLLRIFSVCAVCLFVISSVLRELDDKGLEIILSLPMPRYAYLFGKLFGFAGLSLFICVMAGLPLLLYAPAVRAGFWLLSLFCEHLLIICLSIVCLLTFSNITISFISVMAFYLLSRSIEAICLLSADPVLATGAVSQDFVHFLVNVFALVLPDLNTFARSDWLVYGVDFADMRAVLMQTLLYLTVLLSAGLFDLYRKNL